jgi:hypothetical protein
MNIGKLGIYMEVVACMIQYLGFELILIMLKQWHVRYDERDLISI